MKIKNIIASIAFLILSGGLYFYALSLPSKEGVSAALSPVFYPRLLAIVMGFLSILLLVNGIRDSIKAKGDSEKLFKSKKGASIFGITLVLLIIFPIILTYIGFATASFIFMFVLMYSLTNDRNKKIIPLLIISIILTAVMYLIFDIVLKIPFPSGILI